MIEVNYAIALGVLLFAVGLYGALRSTNAVRILMCIELMLNAVNLVFVAFARLIATAGTAAGAGSAAGSAAAAGAVGSSGALVASAAVTGQVFAIFVMAVAAAEAAVGLAVILQVVRQRGVVQVDKVNLLRG